MFFVFVFSFIFFFLTLWDSDDINIYYFLVILDWVIFVALSSSLLILFSELIILLLSPFIEDFEFLFIYFIKDGLVLYYLVLKFFIWFYFVFSDSLLIPFIFTVFVITCWSIFMKTMLKFLPNDSSIIIASVLASIDCLFFIQLEMFLFLGTMNDVLLKPRHFCYYLMRLWILFKPVFVSCLCIDRR